MGDSDVTNVIVFDPKLWTIKGVCPEKRSAAIAAAGAAGLTQGQWLSQLIDRPTLGTPGELHDVVAPNPPLNYVAEVIELCERLRNLTGAPLSLDLRHAVEQRFIQDLSGVPNRTPGRLHPQVDQIADAWADERAL